MNVYGRRVRIYDMDEFTKDWYAANLGISDFSQPQLPRSMGNTGVEIVHAVPPPTGARLFVVVCACCYHCFLYNPCNHSLVMMVALLCLFVWLAVVVVVVLVRCVKSDGTFVQAMVQKQTHLRACTHSYRRHPRRTW